MSRRRWLGIAAGIAAVPVIACLGLMGSIFASFPDNQGARVEHAGLAGVETGGAYAWVVPTATGVVLVDAGMDPEAQALTAEIGGRTVHAVLVTHGHFDHVGGLAGLPDVPVIIGPGEGPLVRGEHRPGGLMPKMLGFAMPSPGAPTQALREAADSEVVELDGNLFQAIHLPGHTDGSVAWLWRDVLFTGDSLLGFGDRVAPVHWAFATDFDANVASLSKLLAFDFERIADGHAGLHARARPQLEAYLSSP